MSVRLDWRSPKVWLAGLLVLGFFWVHLSPSQRAAALIARGDVRFIQQRHNEALEYYRQAVELTPGDFRGYQRMARTYDASGQLEAALQLYRQALNLKPGHEPTGLLYAQSLLRSRNLVQGRRVLKQILARNPGSMEALFLLGGSWESAGDYERARVWYEAILEIHPHLSHVEFALGSMALREEKYEQALSHFHHVFGQAHGWDVRALEGSVIALLRLGRAEEAEKRRRWVLERGGLDHLPSRMLLIQYYIQQKEKELAREHLEAILNRGVEDEWTRQAQQLYQML